MFNNCNETRINSHLHTKNTPCVFNRRISPSQCLGRVCRLLTGQPVLTSSPLGKVNLSWISSMYHGSLRGLRSSKCNQLIYHTYPLLIPPIQNVAGKNLWQEHKKTSTSLQSSPSSIPPKPSPTWLMDVHISSPVMYRLPLMEPFRNITSFSGAKNSTSKKCEHVF